MKKLVTILLLLPFFTALQAASKEKNPIIYQAIAIDSSLRKDAYAIVRDYQHEFFLKSASEATEKVKVAITILEKAGSDFARLALWYDKSRKILSVSGKCYNALGLPDDKLKNSQISDHNITSAGSIFDDMRYKVADAASESYPYTVVYEYELEYDGILGCPEWQPISNYRISVEQSSFAISFPDSIQLRYREFRLPENCRSERSEQGIKTIEWKASNLPARKAEPYAPRLRETSPLVVAAPTYFSYDGFSGKMDSWKNFGQFIQQLNLNRDTLSAPRRQEIAAVVASCQDTLQIVKRLYEYMQGRTRYVSIQMGIGGYQPFPAMTVDRLGYGDCKALSNYMKAILNSAGIKSNYVIAGTAHNKGITMADFPTFGQNNHAIICVPLHNDTIWLECTSQQQPFGYLGHGTAGRNVLLITPDGGKIAKTPLLPSNKNQQIRSGQLVIQPDGTLSGSIETHYIGYQFDQVERVLTESVKEQEKSINQNYAIPGLQTGAFSFQSNKERIPEATEKLEFTTKLYLTKSGQRLFVPLNPFNKVNSIPESVENRIAPIELSYAYFDHDTITYKLPAGYSPESVPKGKTISSPFGQYSCTITRIEDKIVYSRKLEFKKGEWPKEEYNALIEFTKAVVAADKLRLVLVRDNSLSQTP